MTSFAKPKISVALCTYNGEKFLRAQLDSIAAQAHLPDEIIICDDRSEDATLRIIEEFANGSAISVKHQINPERLGVTQNFAKAIGLTSGDIIFLSDQDDIWHAEKIARMLPYFSRAALVFSNGRVIDDNLRSLGYTLWESMWFNQSEQETMRAGQPLPVLLRHAVAAGATLAFKSAYRDLILPIPDLPHCHDIWTTLLLACADKIYPLGEKLIDYRLHTTNQVGLKKHGLLSQIRMARWQLRFGAFQYAADLHRAALTRLQQHNMLSERDKRLLTAKIQHSEIRHAMPRNLSGRLGPVWREFRNHHYAQYSYGFKSVLQDLFLR